MATADAMRALIEQNAKLTAAVESNQAAIIAAMHGRLADDDHPAASTGADPTCYTPTSFTVDTRSFNRRIFD